MHTSLGRVTKWLPYGNDPATFVGVALMVVGFLAMVASADTASRNSDNHSRARWVIIGDFILVCLGGLGGVVFAQLHGNFPVGASGIAAIVYFMLSSTELVIMLRATGWEAKAQASIITVGTAAIGAQLGEYYASGEFSWLAAPMYHFARGATALFVLGLGVYIVVTVYDFIRVKATAMLTSWRNYRDMRYVMRHPQENHADQQVNTGNPPNENRGGPGLA